MRKFNKLRPQSKWVGVTRRPVVQCSHAEPTALVFQPAAATTSVKYAAAAMKRRQQGSGGHGGKGSRKRVSEHSARHRPKAATDTPTTAFNWRKIALALVGLALLAVAIYSVLPKDFSGPSHKDSEEAQRHAMAQRMEDEEGEGLGEDDGGEWRHTGIACERLMTEARHILEHEPRWNWETALDLLASCVLQEPENPKPRWNLAVALIQMGRPEEALNFIDEALSMDRSNLDYLKSGGAFLYRMEYYKQAIQCLEQFLELSLHINRWDELLASISIQREDEWMFLYEAGDNVTQIFELLLHSYLQEKQLIKAGYMYKVLIGLQGSKVEPSMLIAYSFFSLGLGDLVNGIQYLRKYTEAQYMAQGYGRDDQAYEVVSAHSLRLFTAGFDSHIISIVRNLLMAGRAVWEEVAYNCQPGEKEAIEFSVTVSQEAVRRVFMRCVLVQGVIPSLLRDGAVVYAENIFGWTPLLHSAALGSPAIMHKLISHSADPQVRTVLAHTSLHIAATRGSYDIVLPMIQAGLKPSEVDYFNRTAMQVACLHRWSAESMAKALQVNMPRGCPAKLKYVTPAKHDSQGGWLSSGVALPKDLTNERCDFDVIPHTADVQQFLFDYLALQRPVLIRGAGGGSEMKPFSTSLLRNKLEQEHGTLGLKEGPMPFADTFGFTVQQTTLRAFLDKMKQLHHQNKDVGSYTEIVSPPFVYETIPPDFPLIEKFKIPTILNPNQTHISITDIYFHLGPAFSGMPPHFHRSSWNLLMYGHTRWFLYPPPSATYVKLNAWDWWLANQKKDRAGAMECVQHPGDILFVPDMWGQASVNLRESVGLASEFVYGASEFSI